MRRKPGALVRWRMRDALFPRSEYRDTWRRLIERLPEARAARLMVGLLELAQTAGEDAVAHRLGELAITDQSGPRGAARPVRATHAIAADRTGPSAAACDL